MRGRRTHRVEGAGGVGLHVAEAGPADGPPVVLVHGWSQHHLCWQRQMAGPLAQEFRLVAPDLRGHGASDKPEDPAAYRDGRLWAGDVAAVIAALGLVRPVLVGWSMGGWVVMDYLRHHGQDGLAGVVLTGAGARTGALADPAVMAARRPDVRAEGMYAADQGVQIEAAIAFAKACTAAPLSKRDMAAMVGWQMLCPPHVRKAARTRDEDWRPVLAGLTRPALVIQGAAERVCLPPMFEEVAAVIPGARAEVWPGCGHMPFREAPERFDAELAAFVRAARQEADEGASA